MAKIINEVSVSIVTDKNGNVSGSAVWRYSITDGDASKNDQIIDDSSVFTKMFHKDGMAGEFWRDGIDMIKTKEGIT